MIFRELQVPKPDSVHNFGDIPADTLEALRIIEPSLYGGPLKTVGRAAYLLGNLDDADGSFAAVPSMFTVPKGVAVVSRRDDETAWLQSLAVAPDARGDGVGTALLAHVERIARRWNLGRVGLLAIGDATIGYYEEHGYRTLNRGENNIVAELYKEV